MVDGEYLFQVGDEKLTAKAGDTVFGPRHVPHTWLQLSDKGKLIYLLQPAGKLEDFFKKMNAFKRPPTTEDIQKAMNETGRQMMGPLLTV